MTAVRRVSQLVVTMGIGSVAILLVLEVTDLIDGDWRRRVAGAVENAAFPDWPLWVSGLVGAAVAIVGIVILIAQLVPPKRGLTTMHPIHRGDDGETWLRGRAAISAVRHEVGQIEGVLDVSASIGRNQVEIEMRIDDRSVLADIDSGARRRLGHEFWTELGLADYIVNLLVTYHPRPPRVR